MREKIGIIGFGVVGQALAKGFEQHTVTWYDKYKLGMHTLEDVCTQSKFIFLCVPTPTIGDRIDLSIMDDVMEKVTSFTDNKPDKFIVIKSTVLPGTTEAYEKKYPHSNILFSPEFLTEANPVEDFLHADRHVVGATNPEVGMHLVDLYQMNFMNTPVYLVLPTAAELAKYASNCFLASKVIFANEMHELCQSLKIDWNDVSEVVGSDKRIGHSHFRVTPERGFSGKCFPKDLVALLKLAEDMRVDTSLLKAAWKKNLEIRTVYDWEEIPGALTLKKQES